MKTFVILAAAALLVASLAATPATAVTLTWYVLPIHHTDGDFQTLAGAGYNGTNAVNGSGMNGVRRVYWSLEGSGVPTGTNFYYIEFFAPTAGGTGWQPIESQFNGSAGEAWPNEAGIPWAGMWGTNHEYVGTDGANDGAWHAVGQGPHTPESEDFNAGANGSQMWLKENSWLYAKWDFGWDINRSWSYIRVGLPVVPEPSSLLALGSGLVALAGFAIRRRS